MNAVQIQAGIVLLAPNHNPARVTKDWLISNKILLEEPSEFVNTSMFSSVETQEVALIVEPQRMIIQLKIINPDSLTRLPQIVKKYTTMLPMVQYRALGINSKWQERNTILAETLKPIFTGKPGLFENAIGEQPLVGGILLWTYNDFQVRLTAEPQPPNACIDFNFHANVAQVDDLHNRLDEFSSVMDHANQVTNALLKV